MKIAVEGCAHGELEKIYDILQGIEKKQNIKLDLLICCGDFQSTRNLEDLETMAVPKKYQDICTFYKYYSGELIAPLLTIFIGGNHEASNFLQELPYGGWVAPNIYYLGYAGVVNINGIRVAGISGIYKGHDYLRGRFEFAPYTEESKKTVYHVRQLEVFRLKQLSGLIDIFLSHDWPRNVYNFGDKYQLFRCKPHFRNEVVREKLGSQPGEELLHILQPSHWFAAHLHCKFAAVVPHINYEAPDDLESNNTKVTKFLALDKCLPKRRFLQILNIETSAVDDEEIRFEYDLEWLTILYNTNHLINVRNSNYYLPGPGGGDVIKERHNFKPTSEELEMVREKFSSNLSIPKNFIRTVEAYKTDDKSCGFIAQPKPQINPQTVQFCETLGIDDPLALALVMHNQNSNFFDKNDYFENVCEKPSTTIEDTTSKPKSPDIESSQEDDSLTKGNVLNNEEINLNNLCDSNIEDGNKSDEYDNHSNHSKSDDILSNVVDDNMLKNATKEKPPIKKFRGRNHSVYNADEDDPDK